MIKILTPFLLLFLFGCDQKKDESKISKITVAFSGRGCESGCPYQVLSIENNCDLKYYAGEFSEKKGFYKGKVSKQTWDSIENQFRKFTLIGIDTLKHQKTDHPQVEFIISKNKSQKFRFQENTGKIVSTDLATLIWFIDIAKKVNLQKSDSLSFETSLQYGSQ